MHYCLIKAAANCFNRIAGGSSHFLFGLILFVTSALPGGGTARGQDTLMRFAHLSDLHIGSGGSEEDLNTSIDDINHLPEIEFVIITGDITEFGSDEELLQAKKLLDKLQKKWYIVPGNHDTKWSESGGNSFRRIFGSETSSFVYKGYLFIGTNCGPNMRMGPGQVPMENLVWMDSLLKTYPDKTMPVFFFNHYPINKELNNWYEVLDRFRDRNLEAIFCGHGHLNKVHDFEGVPGIMGRANIRAKQAAAGYNIVSITGKQIVYRERNAAQGTLPPWCTININPSPLPDWKYSADRKPLSDTTVYVQTKKTGNSITNKISDNANAKGSAHATWLITEKSDVGSSVALFKDLLVYTNTAGEVKAVKTSDGRHAWTFKASGKFYATPLVHREKIIVPCTDGYVYCLNAIDGKLAWKQATGRSIVSSAVADLDRIIVAGSDGHCRAFDHQNGTPLWDYDSVTNFVETKPLVRDGVVFFGSWGNRFYALDTKTGKPRWTWTNGQANRMFSPAACWPVISGDKIFMVSPDRYMTVLNKNTGNLVWRHYDSSFFNRESMGISEDGSKVYVKSLQGKVRALDARADQHKVLWSSDLDLKFDVCPSPLIEEGNLLFVPSQSGVIYALNATTGKLAWQYKISNCLVNTVYPIGKNRLIASTMDGKIVCVSYREK